MLRTYSLLVIFFISTYSFSQKTQFGVFIDPVMSWLSPDVTDVEKDGSLLGINFGLSLDKYFAKNYAFSTGISLNNSGGKLEYLSSSDFSIGDTTYTLDPNTSVKYKLQYVKIPIGLKFTTNEIGYFTFYSHLGFYPQINVKAIGETSLESVKDKNFIKEVNFIDVGYYFGIGTQYSLGGNTSVVVGVTYKNGFINIFPKRDGKVILSTISIRIGILF